MEERRPEEQAALRDKSEEKTSSRGKATEQEEAFSFLQETIKPKEVRKEEIFAQLVKMALYGLIVGCFACCGFYALRPWAQRTFQEEAQEVTIPEDEEEDLEAEEPEEEAEPIVPVLTLDNYKEIMQSMYGIVKEAERCVVSVQAFHGEDWMDETGGYSAATGVIAADNGRELLILTDHTICEGNDQWIVTFSDKSQYQAGLYAFDHNRGLAVFGIERETISANTWKNIQVADLGNSNIIARGDIVIALGGMFGYEHGMGYGIVSSKEYSMNYADGQCSVITTDIAATSDGNGILFNQNGQVIGLIRGNIWADTESASANALAISDLKRVLEVLLNGESVPFAGIYGITVTEEIAKEREIPRGLYVTNVMADSPAMKAGIQNGDVITQVGTEKVTGLVSYEQAILECRTGAGVRIKGQRRGAGDYVEVDYHVTLESME